MPTDSREVQTLKDFHRVGRSLRKQYPAPHPVHIRTVHNLQEDMGHCWFDYNKKCFFIVVERGSLDIMIQTLIHEWAHALTWEASHHDEWGAAYAKCYRSIFPEDDNVL